MGKLQFQVWFWGTMLLACVVIIVMLWIWAPFAMFVSTCVYGFIFLVILELRDTNKAFKDRVQSSIEDE